MRQNTYVKVKAKRLPSENSAVKAVEKKTKMSGVNGGEWCHGGCVGVHTGDEEGPPPPLVILVAQLEVHHRFPRLGGGRKWICDLMMCVDSMRKKYHKSERLILTFFRREICGEKLDIKTDKTLRGIKKSWDTRNTKFNFVNCVRFPFGNRMEWVLFESNGL